jgi:hypothetical protein
MTDVAWKTLFEVRQKETYTYDGDLGSVFHLSYDVINIHNNEPVGNYRDYKYAVKQAKRKYKKLIKLTEKSFMSLTNVAG